MILSEMSKAYILMKFIIKVNLYIPQGTKILKYPYIYNLENVSHSLCENLSLSIMENRQKKQNTS